MNEDSGFRIQDSATTSFINPLSHSPFPPVIWALTDDRPGTAGQVLGVAEKLGLPFEEKPLAYNFLSALPNFVPLPVCSGLELSCKAKFLEGAPDIVIAAGRKAARVARAIKKNHPATRLIHIMRPEGGEADFELIALPCHDKPENHSRIFPFVLTPHRLTREKMDAAKNTAAQHPATTVLVGGSSRHGVMHSAYFERLAADLTAYSARTGHTLYITTSRRTGRAGEDILKHALGESHHLYCYADGGENPYLALLANADALVVTGESISMLSEAIYTHKPVFIYPPPQQSAKLERFTARIIKEGWAKEFGEEDFIPTPSPDSAADIAQATLKRLGNKVMA